MPVLSDVDSESNTTAKATSALSFTGDSFHSEPVNSIAERTGRPIPERSATFGPSEAEKELLLSIPAARHCSTLAVQLLKLS